VLRGTAVALLPYLWPSAAAIFDTAAQILVGSGRVRGRL